MPSFYEFFAGGGMARLGLGPHWSCLFANDVDPRKAAAYRANFQGHELKVGDVGEIAGAGLPGHADLAWGSFPCQDLSLAGLGGGLQGRRSGTFYPFWRVMDDLARAGRAPGVIAMENVCGTLTSQGGAGFEAICATFERHGYRSGSLVMDAELFVPQSRPRLFIVGVRAGLTIDPALLSPDPLPPFHSRGLVRAVDRLPEALRARQLWWKLPPPSRRACTLDDLIEEALTSVGWSSDEETRRLLGLMSATNLAKVTAATRAGRRRVGGVYRRTRLDDQGRKVQRAEVRFDDVSGCLRTPAGGSSRQRILVVEGPVIRSRLISPRETARLMGLPDSYRLPRTYNAAYHLTGDGLVVDVVRHLARHLLEPLVARSQV